MATILKYPYTTRRKLLVLGAIMFSACTALFVHECMTNDRGLLIDGILRLSTQGATIFYGVFAALSAAFVVLAIMALIAAAGKTLTVELTDQFLYAPKNIFAHEPLTIPLNEITGITVQTIQGQKLLNIRHLGGKLSISGSMLPDNAAFEALCTALAAAIKPQ